MPCFWVEFIAQDIPLGQTRITIVRLNQALQSGLFGLAMLALSLDGT